MFQPVLSALGLMNSLGISHLGISPDTLRVTQDNSLLITSFSIQAARREGTSLEAELAPGCAAVEQYSTKGSLWGNQRCIRICRYTFLCVDG